MLPLEGIRIVDLGQAQQGPHAAVLLSDMGADVIKVEPRTGDFSRGALAPAQDEWGTAVRDAYILAHNRNKRSLAIDITVPQGREALLRLAERGDVFLHNFRPGVAERLGIDYPAIKARNPRVIYASGSGFGKEGPGAQRPGFDLVGQAVSGFMVQAGLPGAPPHPAGAAVADQTGSILLAYGVMLALFVRERSGVGQEVDVSLLGSMLCLQSWEVTTYLLSGRLPPKAGRGHPLIRGLWQIFPTSDGWISLAGCNDVRWPGFCRALGIGHLQSDPRFATAQERADHLNELVPLLDKVFLARTTAEWQATLEAVDAIVGPVQSYVEAVADPQVAANGYIGEVQHPRRGRVRVVGLPVRLSETPGRIKGPAPELGEHTTEVLRELGYSWEEIAALAADEVI